MIKGINKLLGINQNQHIFYGSVMLIVLFILFGSFSPEALAQASSATHAWIPSRFGWFFFSSPNIFLIVSLLIAFSPSGSVKLCKDDDQKALIILGTVILDGLAIFLVLSDGVKALLTASIVGALPFLFIIFFSPFCCCFRTIQRITKQENTQPNLN